MLCGNGPATNHFVLSEVRVNPASEDLVLYKWDGVSLTVKNVDYFVWGASMLVRSDKTGCAGYLADTPAASQQSMSAATTVSTDHQRAGFGERGEPTAGGNGLTGHNETAENLAVNWIVDVPGPRKKTDGGYP